MNERVTIIKHSLLGHCVLVFGDHFFLFTTAAIFLYFIPPMKNWCLASPADSCWLFFCFGFCVWCNIWFLTEKCPFEQKLSASSSACFSFFFSRNLFNGGQFRSHALVKRSPDASSFNYTRIVMLLRFNESEALP